jgi:diaminobutyrate-2-oxoglutarate transaminase
MASGLATLRVIQQEKLVDRAHLLGDRFQDNLRAIQADAPWLGDVRGRGLMVGVEIVDVDAPVMRHGRPPAASTLARQVQRECLKRGLIIELGGRFGSVVRFLPPLIITAAELDDVCAIFREAVLAARRVVGPPALAAQTH